MYDLIGDIHGHADELIQLLEQLGYGNDLGWYRHPRRKAVFVGDFIDRGPQIPRVLETVQGMVEHEAALAVMGNHEFNALAYHTADPRRPGEFLRPHTEKNNRQHQATLDQLSPAQLASQLQWFRTLPVALDLGAARVVHACWDPGAIKVIEDGLEQYGRFTTEFMGAATDCTSPLFDAVENVLKGPETLLPDGVRVADKEGHLRSRMRIRWYEPAEGKTYRQYALSAETGFPDQPLPAEVSAVARSYPADDVPVFFGHYWLRGQPQPLAPNVACLDYSVAKDGCLCAYRWSGEQTLSTANFLFVESGLHGSEFGSH